MWKAQRKERPENLRHIRILNSREKNLKEMMILYQVIVNK
jgi:hypothetical protein